jgi:hypothetical protein
MRHPGEPESHQKNLAVALAKTKLLRSGLRAIVNLEQSAN